MVEFTQRQKRIVTILAHEANWLSGSDLALILQASLRTVQTEVKAINQDTMIIRSSRKGYRLLTDNIGALHTEDSILPEHVLLAKLLNANGPIDTGALADSLFISESTLSRSLNKLKNQLSPYNIQIDQQHGTLSLIGKELNKRQMIGNLIQEESQPQTTANSYLGMLVNHADMQLIKTQLLQTLHDKHFYADSNYLHSLVINLAIAVDRMRSNLNLHDLSNLDSSLATSEEFQVAQDFCHAISEALNLRVNKHDELYVTSLLYGFIKPDSEATSQRETLITQAFIDDMASLLATVFHNFMLDIDPSKLLYAFCLHTNALIKRARNHTVQNHNVFARNIKNSSPFIYEVAVAIAEGLSQQYNIEINDDEIGLISIHIGYLINEAQHDDTRLVVQVMCPDYPETKRLIQQQLLKDYEQSVHSMTDDSSIASIYTPDLLLTTDPDAIANCQVVYISPFLSIEDHVHIDSAIHQALEQKMNARSMRLLGSYFQDDLFFVDKSIQTQTDAIKFLTNKMSQFGIANQDFASSVLKREQQSTTAFFNAFAIPHATNLDANTTMFGVLVNPDGIRWGDTSVQMVLLIAIRQDEWKSFVPIYNDIVKALSDAPTRDHLAKAQSLPEFLHFLTGSQNQ